MMNTLKRFLVPLALLVIVVMAYGLLIPSLGFYGDDWSYIYYHQLLGFKGPGEFAAYDRPFSAPFYNLTIGLLGLSPLPYHIFLLILRWLSAVLLWQVLKRIWPGHEKAIFWMAALFCLYPGFTQQSISVEYILHFSGLDLTLLSFLLMLDALKPSRWRWAYIAGGMLCASNLFAIEYFFGLELLRPVILWIALSDGKRTIRARLKAGLAAWAPYLLVLGAFLIWRVFFFQFPTYNPGLLDKLAENPLDGLIYLAKRLLNDFKAVLYDAWRQTLDLPSGHKNRILYGLAVLVSAVVFALVQWRIKDVPSKDGEGRYDPLKDWAWQPVLFGAFALLVAGWPFWITGIPLEMGFPWDRPTLPFMLGVGMLLVGLVELFFRRYYRFLPLFALSLLAVGFQVTNAEVYAQEWERMTSFYWQLTWRMPDLQPGTVLAGDDIPLYRVADSAMTAPLNWTFAPDLHGRDLAYKVFDLNVRIGTEYTGIPAIEEGLPIMHDYRFTRFSSDTSSLLVFDYPAGGCVHILSPQDAILPGLPQKTANLAVLSKPGLIVLDAAGSQPPDFMGPEPTHDWCYFYQKAELAAQREDWAVVIELAEEAGAQGLHANTPSERRVFMQANAQQGRLDEALALAGELGAQVDLAPVICTDWQGILTGTDFSRDDYVLILDSLQAIGCDLGS